MSLAYNVKSSGGVFWLGAGAVSLALHVMLPASLLVQTPQIHLPEPKELGVTGAILFDLADIVASPSDALEDSVERAETKAAPTVTESPEAVETSKAADQPLLAQIPYDVEDESLKFAVAAPEPEVETEVVADEVATEFDPNQVEAASQLGAEEQQGSVASVAGNDGVEQADSAQAQSEGLTAEQKAEIHAWQKAVVVKVSKAKVYPPQARRRKIEGEVHVRFTLDTYGRILTVEIAKSSGWPVLDQAALRTLRNIGKMPTPPNQMKLEELTLLIPLRYRFK